MTENELRLEVKAGCERAGREKALNAWYRAELRTRAAPYIKRWAKAMKLEEPRVFVQRMKTRWGSCNHDAGTIRLNSELAKHAEPCLEYIVVHELVHLLEPSHNMRFRQLLSSYLPDWQQRRDALNAGRISGHLDRGDPSETGP